MVKCRMALMRAGLWDNVSGNEGAPAGEEAAKYSKSMARRDRDQATGGVNRSIIIVFDWRPRRSPYCTCMAQTF